MASPDDFVAFILTHGRAGSVATDITLRKAGYTGPIVFIVDDEDKDGLEYKKQYGADVQVFCKKEWADKADEMDNLDKRQTILHARNACFSIAKKLGYKYFVQLDDDYTAFKMRTDAAGQYVLSTPVMKKNLGLAFQYFVNFLESTGCHAVAMAQGGDFIGGHENQNARLAPLTRKCMNTFFCATDRPFMFKGRLNEDVTTYTGLGRVGMLFFTVPLIAVAQKTTQKTPGGMSETYHDSGTFVKSFYTVMASPDCVTIGMLSTAHSRIHHSISWKHAVPVIIRQGVQKAHGKSEAENEGRETVAS